jgi:sec-independent protein translocase protein TatB
MFDIGWSELIVVGVVALIVVGPRDLPKMLRTVGQYVNKARSMAREFQRNMEEAAKDSGMEDVAKAARSMGDVRRMVGSPATSLAQFGLDRTKAAATSPAPAATAAPPATAAPATAPGPAPAAASSAAPTATATSAPATAAPATDVAAPPA